MTSSPRSPGSAIRFHQTPLRKVGKSIGTCTATHRMHPSTGITASRLRGNDGLMRLEAIMSIQTPPFTSSPRRRGSAIRFHQTPLRKVGKSIGTRTATHRMHPSTGITASRLRGNDGVIWSFRFLIPVLVSHDVIPASAGICEPLPPDATSPDRQVHREPHPRIHQTDHPNSGSCYL
jgi:hypothetical protein